MSEKLKRILYIEDDEDIAEITQMTLEDLGGFEVRYCSSGKLALEEILKFDAQLILTDVMMPEMGGPEVFENLKQMPEAKNIPLIFMTAKVQTLEQQSYKDIGALGLVMKPYDPLNLCDEIKQHWENRND